MDSKSYNRRFYLLQLAVLAIFIGVFADADVINTIHDRHGLDVAKESPGGAAVYFGKTLIDSFDGRELREFYRSFKKAAKYMKDFGVIFYEVDCFLKTSDFEKECKNNKGSVVFYSKEDIPREEEFSLSFLLQEDHIVAHALHFLLANDVPIVQKKSALDEIVKASIGNKDVILAYAKGLGDPEDRYFMEAAFVYGKQHQFVVTTQPELSPSSGALWYFHCKKAKSSENYEIITRKHKPNNVLDVIQFMKLQHVERIVELQNDGSTSFDNMDITFPLNKVYLFDDGLERIKSFAESALEEVGDNFYFILVDILSHPDRLEKFGLDTDAQMPNMVFQSSSMAGSQQSYYEQWHLDQEFTPEALVKTINQYIDNPNKAYYDIVNLVNIEYDRISSWKKPDQLAVIGGCMDEMSSCAAYKIAFRRLARSLVYATLDLDFLITYVDFTRRPNDAKLNTLPGFMILKDGKEFKLKGETDYESMLKFSKEHLSPSVRYLPLSGSDHIEIPAKVDAEGNIVMGNEESEEEEGETQAMLFKMEDDVMGKLAVDTLKKGIKDENVTSLTEKTFNKTRDENELMITLFYLPWCIKSIMFRGYYAEVADKIEKAENLIKTSVNKVNCFNWNDLCHKEGIIRYPVIKVYRKGISPISYTGAYDVDTLVQTIQMFQGPVIKKLNDNKSLNMFTNEQALPEGSASVLGIFKSEDDHELATFKRVAEQMFGKYSFAYAAGNIAKQSAQSMQANLPSFMVLKRNDPIESMVKGNNFQNMKEFIEKHGVPSFGELTALNYPKYNMLGKPFIIQFKQRNDTKMDKTLKTLAGKTQSALVTWMDIDKLVTQEIMKSYNIKNLNEPVLVLVSHKKGEIYKYTKDNDVNIMLKWIEDCLANKVESIAVLEDKEWKPLREGYDYLELVKKADQAIRDRSTTIEESEQPGVEATPEEVVVSDEMKEKPRRDEL